MVNVLSTIIVNYNTAHLLDECLNKLEVALNGFSNQIIIVDNASSDNSVHHIESKYPKLTLIKNKTNVGFGRANNQALDYLTGEYVLLLNTDAFVSENTIELSLQYLIKNPDVGILGVSLTCRDGSPQPSCRFFPTPLNIFTAKTGLHNFFRKVKLIDDPNLDITLTQECDWVPGCYYLTRRKLINEIGLFDNKFFMYYEEVDHCFRAKKAGWKVVYFSETNVVHIGGESAKSQGEITSAGKQLSALQLESELIYFRQNHGILASVLNISLSLFVDTYLALKSLFKSEMNEFNRHEKNIKLILTLIFKTKLGTVPTR